MATCLAVMKTTLIPLRILMNITQMKDPSQKLNSLKTSMRELLNRGEPTKLIGITSQRITCHALTVVTTMTLTPLLTLLIARSQAQHPVILQQAVSLLCLHSQALITLAT